MNNNTQTTEQAQATTETANTHAPRATHKVYECAKCGTKETKQTNHFGSCYSLGRYNQCPKCPKYQPCDGPALIPAATTWNCTEKPEAKEVETTERAKVKAPNAPEVPTVHLVKVKYISPTNTKGARISLTSQRFEGDRAVISYHKHETARDIYEMALIELTERGFSPLFQAEGPDNLLFVAVAEFRPITEKRAEQIATETQTT